jgi:UPF0716 family protein affecting phage T7 exclusion
VIFVMAPELLGVFSAYMGLVFAAVLIGIILLAPAGIEELVRRAMRGGRRGAAR